MNAAEQGHLDDDRLVGARTGRFRLRRHERAHLVCCPDCAARDREWADALAASQAAARTAADAACSPARLARQRDAILRRLQRLEPARVLAFPTTPATDALRPRRTRLRWIAAALAAGLVIAAFTGQYVGLAPRHTPPHRAVTSASVRAPRAAATAHMVAITDDEFLLQVDNAIEKPTVAELREIDDLTPRLREATIRIR